MPLGGSQSYGIVVVGRASFRTDPQFISFVSPNTLRVPVFTPTNVAPPHQVDFQFPNVALRAFAQSNIPPVGEFSASDHPPPPYSPPADFLFPNIVLLQPVPLPADLSWAPWPKTPQPYDFQFPNLSIRQPIGMPIGEMVEESKPASQTRQLDFQFPNLAVFLRPVVNQIFDRPPPPTRPFDIQPTNIPILAAAQAQVRPIGAALDETVPSPQAHPFDFQFANVAALNRAQSLVFPIGEQLEEVRPAPPIRQLDFQFANVALQAFAQSLVHPVGAALDESVPAPQPRPVDLLPANLPVRQPVAPPPAAHIFERPLIVRPPQDLLAPNLLTSTLSVTYEPAAAVWGSWPQPPLPPQDLSLPNLVLGAIPPVTSPNTVRGPVFTVQYTPPRPIDFQFANIVLATTAIPPDLTKLFRPPLITRQAPKQPPTDPPLPNLLTTTLSPVVQKPVVPSEFADKPAPQQRVQEFVPPNIPALDFAQRQIKPIGPKPIFERPIATALPVDAPIPNLLTTTLSVTPQKPPFTFIFERPALLAQPRDAAQINLLPTLLQTVSQKPPVANFSLFADRPLPQSPPWDPPPVNYLVFRPPPPPPSAELHQNPMFTTMGRLSQLGNLP